MKFSIITFGCSFNKHDSEVLISNLQSEEYIFTPNPEEAELIIINSCAVKNMSESKAFQTLNKYEKQGKKIIMAGCVPQSEPELLNTKLKNYSTIGTNNLEEINQIVQETLNNKITHKIKKEPNKNNTLVKNLRLENINFRFNNLIEIIPINEGCLNKCTYCKTKFARGNLKSYPIEIIVNRIKTVLDNGVHELWITSQDIACYGFDIETNLNELLIEILKIKKDFKIRLGMGNPRHFKKIFNELLKIIKTDNRIYKFLHIPIQSGNNRILKEMKRGNTMEDFNILIKQAQKTIPEITIATDIIVAYPTETEIEFLDSVNTLKKLNISVMNGSRFWLRKGTEAEKYNSKEFINGTESKKRIKILLDTFKKNAEKLNKKLIGKIYAVTIIEQRKNNTFTARNDSYKPIIITGNYKIGQQLTIKITNADHFLFYGKQI